MGRPGLFLSVCVSSYQLTGDTWLLETTHVQEVVGLNSVYWTDISSQLFVAKIVMFV